jgi:hypothetical protein
MTHTENAKRKTYKFKCDVSCSNRKGLFETDLIVPSYNKKQIAVAQKGVQHEILFCVLFETGVL